MHTIILVTHVVISLLLVGFILLQHGKGADAGAAFGSGASGTVFGSGGSANFLSKTTAWLAVLFFITSIVLVFLTTKVNREEFTIEGVESSESVVVPEGDAIPESNAIQEKNVTESIPE